MVSSCGQILNRIALTWDLCVRAVYRAQRGAECTALTTVSHPDPGPEAWSHNIMCADTERNIYFYILY